MCHSLNGAHEIIKVHIISIGLINRTVVHPREVFYPAIIDGAVALIITSQSSKQSSRPVP